MDPMLQVLILVFFSSLLTMYLLRLQIKIMPKRYFHFARLIDGLDEDVPYIGVAFRLIVPLIAGYGPVDAQPDAGSRLPDRHLCRPARRPDPADLARFTALSDHPMGARWATAGVHE